MTDLVSVVGNFLAIHHDADYGPLERFSRLAAFEMSLKGVRSEGAAADRTRLEHLLIPIGIRLLIIVLDRVSRISRQNSSLIVSKARRPDRLLTLRSSDHVLEIWRLLWTRPPLLLRQFFLLYIPLLLARLQMNLKACCAVLSPTDIANQCFRTLDDP